MKHSEKRTTGTRNMIPEALNLASSIPTTQSPASLLRESLLSSISFHRAGVVPDRVRACDNLCPDGPGGLMTIIHEVHTSPAILQAQILQNMSLWPLKIHKSRSINFNCLPNIPKVTQTRLLIGPGESHQSSVSGILEVEPLMCTCILSHC